MEIRALSVRQSGRSADAVVVMVQTTRIMMLFAQTQGGCVQLHITPRRRHQDRKAHRDMFCGLVHEPEPLDAFSACDHRREGVNIPHRSDRSDRSARWPESQSGVVGSNEEIPLARRETHARWKSGMGRPLPFSRWEKVARRAG